MTKYKVWRVDNSGRVTIHYYNANNWLELISLYQYATSEAIFRIEAYGVLGDDKK